MAGRADYYKTANNFFFCSNNVTKIAPRRPSESLPRSLSPSWECASFTLIYRDPQSTGHSHIFTELVLFSHPGRRNRPHCFSGNSPQVMAPPPPSAGNHHDACPPPFPTSSLCGPSWNTEVLSTLLHTQHRVYARKRCSRRCWLEYNANQIVGTFSNFSDNQHLSVSWHFCFY